MLHVACTISGNFIVIGNNSICSVPANDAGCRANDSILASIQIWQSITRRTEPSVIVSPVIASKPNGFSRQYYNQWKWLQKLACSLPKHGQIEKKIEFIIRNKRRPPYYIFGELFWGTHLGYWSSWAHVWGTWGTMWLLVNEENLNTICITLDEF